jgi:cytoskeletal protein CcmA (bactofilin family)
MSTYKNVSGDFILSTQGADDEIVVTAREIIVNGNVDVNGNVTADFFFGDGQFLSNVVANIGSASKLQNGTSNVDIPVINGNITFGVSGTGNVIIVTNQTANITTTTTSTNKFNGALVVAGGVGVGGNLYGGQLYADNQQVLNVISIIDGGTF